MDEKPRAWNVTTVGSQRAARAYQFAIRQPNWVSRLAMLAFLLVVAIPILTLVFLALLVATVVFLGLATLHAIGRFFRGIGPRRDGRANVRVIRRGDA